MFIILLLLKAMMLFSTDVFSAEDHVFSIRMSDDGIPLQKSSSVLLKPVTVSDPHFGPIQADLVTDTGGIHELSTQYSSLKNSQFKTPSFQIRFPIQLRNLINDEGAYGTSNLVYAYAKAKPNQVKFIDPLPLRAGECKMLRGNFAEPIQTFTTVLPTQVKIFSQSMEMDLMENNGPIATYFLTKSTKVSLPELDYAYFEVCKIHQKVQGKINLSYKYSDPLSRSTWNYQAELEISLSISQEGRINGSLLAKKIAESFSGRYQHSVTPLKKIPTVFSLRDSKINLNLSEMVEEKTPFQITWRSKGGKIRVKNLPNLYQVALDHLIKKFPSSLRGRAMALPRLKSGEKRNFLVKAGGGNLKISLSFD